MAHPDKFAAALHQLQAERQTINTELSYTNRHRRYRWAAHMVEFKRRIASFAFVGHPRAVAAFLDTKEWTAAVADDPHKLHSHLWRDYNSSRQDQEKLQSERMQSGEMFHLREIPEVTIVQFDVFGVGNELKAIAQDMKAKDHILVIDRDFKEIS